MDCVEQACSAGVVAAALCFVLAPRFALLIQNGHHRITLFYVRVTLHHPEKITVFKCWRSTKSENQIFVPRARYVNCPHTYPHTYPLTSRTQSTKKAADPPP